MVTVGTEPRALGLLGSYANEGILCGLVFSENQGITPAEYYGVQWLEFQPEYGIACGFCFLSVHPSEYHISTLTPSSLI
jgi:hypothetical protein